LNLLEAANLIKQRGVTVRVVFCGSEPPGGTDYTARVRGIGEQLNAEFAGWRDDVREVLNRLDLLVIPSSNEGLPRVMLEAFSAGVPVMAFPTGGIPEAIENNVTGFLVPECSAESLARRILEIHGDASLRHRVAVNARRRWEELYSLATYRSQMIELMGRQIGDLRHRHLDSVRRLPIDR
jgi:glycosyltransferase involved in cell wall biosynthesis